MDSTLALIAIAALIGVMILWARTSDLRSRVDSRDELIRSLTARIFALESARTAAPPPPAAAAPPAIVAAVIAAAPPPVVEATREAEPRQAEPQAELQPEAAIPPPLPPLPLPSPPIDWEALIGGNILAKLGVLMTVVAVALFLRYTFGSHGPLGKVIMGLAFGASMLGVGVALELRELYRTYGRGLIGGGWAALYFTVYAAHAIDAAKIIDSPELAAILLMLTAAGMLAHSLYYRSETVTGMAFAVAYLTLEISPMSRFSQIASIPLAATLVGVAKRFEWTRLAAGGVVLTYLTHALDFHGFDSSRWVTQFGEPILWLYWLLFEAFDLIDFKVRGVDRGLSRSIFPLNAIGFLGASILAWPRDGFLKPDTFLFAAAGAYLASALLRYWLHPPDRETNPLEEGASGGFASAITLSTGLLVCAIGNRFEGMQITFGWMLVAEFLVLCGILMRLTYLRSLGAAIFLPVLFKFFVLDVTRNDTVNSLGRDWRIWSPAAALLTILFFGNRKLTGFPGYSVAGSIVLAAVLLGEVRHDWLTLAFTLAACALAGVGVRAARDEFLFEGGAFAIVALLAFWDREPSAYPWLTIALPAALFYAAGFLYATRLKRHPLPGHFLLGGGVTLLLGFLTRVVPAEWAAPAWAAVMLATWAAYVRWPDLPVVGQCVVLPVAVLGQLTVPIADATTRHLARGLVAASFYAAEFWPPRSPRGHYGWFRDSYSVIGTILIAVLLIDKVPERGYTIAFGALSTVLLSVGIAAAERILRLTGLVLFLGCVLKLFFVDLSELDPPMRILSFLVLGLLLLGVSWAYTRYKEQIKRLL